MMSTIEKKIAAIIKELEEHTLSIENKNSLNNYGKVILKSPSYTFDHVLMTYNNENDLITFKCDLGALRPKFEKVFGEKVSLCDIKQEFLNLNLTIDYKMNFNFEYNAIDNIEKLALFFIISNEKFLQNASYYLHNLSNNIRENIELIRYVTLPNDNNYISIRTYRN